MSAPIEAGAGAMSSSWATVGMAPPKVATARPAAAPPMAPRRRRRWRRNVVECAVTGIAFLCRMSLRRDAKGELDDVPAPVATVTGLVLQQWTSGGGGVSCYSSLCDTVVREKDATAYPLSRSMCEGQRRSAAAGGGVFFRQIGRAHV